MKLKKPTVFMTVDELKEAESLGILNNDLVNWYIEDIFKTPTILWFEDGRILHQTYNDCIEDNNWAKPEYIKRLQESVMWADVKHEYWQPREGEWYYFWDNDCGDYFTVAIKRINDKGKYVELDGLAYSNCSPFKGEFPEGFEHE